MKKNDDTELTCTIANNVVTATGSATNVFLTAKRHKKDQFTNTPKTEGKMLGGP